MADDSELVQSKLFDPSDGRNPKIFTENFTAIGHVAAAWAYLEWSINRVIWALADLEPEAGQCITAHIATIQSRTRMLLALFRLNGGEEKLAVEINKFFVNKVDAASKARNRVVHDPLAADPSGEVVRVTVTADKRHKAEVSLDPIVEAESALDAITDAIREFKNLRHRMIAALPTSPKKPL